MVAVPLQKTIKRLLIAGAAIGGIVVAGLIVLVGIGAFTFFRFDGSYFHGPPIEFSNIDVDTAPESMCEHIDWLAPLDFESGEKPEFFMGPTTVLQEDHWRDVEVQLLCGGAEHGPGQHYALFENDDMSGVLSFKIRFHHHNHRASSFEGDDPQDVPDLDNWSFSKVSEGPRPYASASVLHDHGASQEEFDVDDAAGVHLELGYGTAHVQIRLDAFGDTDTYSAETLTDAAIELADEVFEYLTEHSEEIGY